MRKTLFLLAAGTAMAAAGPAYAQGTDATFTGPRVEAIVGWDKLKAGSSVDDDADIGNKQSMDGVMYGIGVGYDMDLSGFVVGVEGEYSDSDAKASFADGEFEGFGFGSVKTNRDMYAGVRAGMRVGDQALAYIKGGYTNTKLDALSNDGTRELRRDFDLDGWRVGGGAEVAFGANAFAKLEYRYSQYQEAEIDFSGDVPDSNRFDIDTDRHQIVAGVGWRF